MVERMLAAGIVGLPPRVAAWCAGHVPDEELLKDIEAASNSRSTDLMVRTRWTRQRQASAEPGIDIRKLKPGTIHPRGGGTLALRDQGRVSGPRHRGDQFQRSAPARRYRGPGAPERPLAEPRLRRSPRGSARGCALEIRFRNGLYRTQPLTAASVSGTSRRRRERTLGSYGSLWCLTHNGPCGAVRKPDPDPEQLPDLHRSCYLDTETCGLHSMMVLLQYAEEDGPIMLHEVWRRPIRETLAPDRMDMPAHGRGLQPRRSTGFISARPTPSSASATRTGFPRSTSTRSPCWSRKAQDGLRQAGRRPWT